MPTEPAGQRGGGSGEGTSSRGLLKPGVWSLWLIVPLPLAQNHRKRVPGPPPSLDVPRGGLSPGCVSAGVPDECSCLCARRRPMRSVSLAVVLAPKARSSGVPATNVSTGCVPAPGHRTLGRLGAAIAPPSPHSAASSPGASRGVSPPPCSVFGTERPHRPVLSPNLVPASTEEQGGYARAPSPRGRAGPPGPGRLLQWHKLLLP